MTSETVSDQKQAGRFSEVPWSAVVVYVVAACGLAWLVSLPLWLVDFEPSAYAALFSALAAAMMFTPAIAVLIVVFLMKAPARERMRLLGIWPLRPAKRIVWFVIAMMFVPLLLVFASLGISVLFGWAQLDLVHFSGFQQMLDEQLAALDPATAELAASTMPPLGLLIALQVAMVPIGAVLNMVPALGEEIGWRGWLVPALRPLGVWPALLLSGLVWGLWHSPLILLGYNFNRTDWSGVALMTIGCVAWGVFFGWLRLRTGSVWPATVAHGSLNAAAGLCLILLAADVPVDMALINPLGVPGWIVMAVVSLVLLALGQFKREPALAPAKPKRPFVPPVQAGAFDAAGLNNAAGSDDGRGGSTHS